MVDLSVDGSKFCKDGKNVVSIGALEGCGVGERCTLKFTNIHFNLVIEAGVPLEQRTLVNELTDDLFNQVSILLQIHDIILIAHDALVVVSLLDPVLLNGIDLAKLPNRVEEVICCASQLRLEEGEPEDLGVHASLELLDDFCSEVVAE